MDKQSLRQELRLLRASIPTEEREIAAHKLSAQASAMPCFSQAHTVAIYWPHDNEINSLPLLDAIFAQKKRCFLPILCLKNRQSLAFAEYTKQTPLIKNRYDIPEPEVSFSSMIDLADLEVIFVPVVGFDSQGRRLGRGGGFYDATFSELRRSHPTKWPKIIGLAYACQQVAEIPADEWDWHLDAIVTEKTTMEFNRD